MRRCISVCIISLVSSLAAAQEQPATGASAQPRSLHVEVVEGDHAINNVRLHRGHDPVVRVVDAAGAPVPGVSVTFLLPGTGPSAAFPDGGLSSTTLTDEHGEAFGRGLRPNSVTGQFQIRVTANSHGINGVAEIVQTNAEPGVQASHTKWFVIAAAVAGAAAGGAVLAMHGKSSPADTGTTTTQNTGGGSISAGTPIFGPPH